MGLIVEQYSSPFFAPRSQLLIECKAEGRLPNPDLLDPKKGPDPDLPLNHCQYLTFFDMRQIPMLPPNKHHQVLLDSEVI